MIFGESEIPGCAPDPAMAERRLGFYARSGARTAGYDTAMFGVPYKTLYWAAGDVDEAALMAEHRYVYESTFAPDKFAKYVRIPPGSRPGTGGEGGMAAVRERSVKHMKILAFESSCDETAVAVVEDGRTILSDAIASQADFHALYGRRGAGDRLPQACGGDRRPDGAGPFRRAGLRPRRH